MDLFFDITIMSLLLVTITYAMRLNSKLNAIRNHRMELKASIKDFQLATEKANNTVIEMQKQGKTLCKEISEKISNARKSSDEIDFMLTRARKSMQNLQEPARAQVTPIRPQVQQVAKPQMQPTRLTREQQIEQRLRAANIEVQYDNQRDDYMSLSEQELLKAMRDREFKQALMS